MRKQREPLVALVLLAIPLACGSIMRSGGQIGSVTPINTADTVASLSSADVVRQSVSFLRGVLVDRTTFDGCSVLRILHGDTTAVRRIARDQPGTIGSWVGDCSRPNGNDRSVRIVLDSMYTGPGQQVVLVATRIKGELTYTEEYHLDRRSVRDNFYMQEYLARDFVFTF